MNTKTQCNKNDKIKGKKRTLRAEREKRQQICALIPILAERPFRQFIQIYKNFVFLSFKKCTYIFFQVYIHKQKLTLIKTLV